MSLLNNLCKHLQCRLEKVSFGSNNLNQTFSVVADQTGAMVRRNFGPFIFTKLFQFSNILRMSGANHSRGHATAFYIRLRSGHWATPAGVFSSVEAILLWIY